MASRVKFKALVTNSQLRIAWGCLGLVSCAVSHQVGEPVQASPPTDCLSAAAEVWAYEVQSAPAATHLSIRAVLPAGVPKDLGVDRYAHPFVSNLRQCTPGGWQAVERFGSGWSVPECASNGCELRYEYLLERAAKVIDRQGYAAYRAGVLLAPPSTWLIHPKHYMGENFYEFSLHTAPGDSFVSGVWSEINGGTRLYRAPAKTLFQAPYSGFGRLDESQVQVGASVLNVSISPNATRLNVSVADLEFVFKKYATLVQQYYGQFPVSQLNLLVLPTRGHELFGMELGNGGASVLLYVGEKISLDVLQADWVILHEMLHTGFPSMDRSFRFLAEGLATYQEGLIRVRAGLWSERDLWTQMLNYFPAGRPQRRGGGLSQDRSWGRTYWGGALLCLLLDLELRQGSGGVVSLDHVAREIVRLGGSTAERWTFAEVVQVFARVGAGTRAAHLLRRHTQEAVLVDLDALYGQLGVSMVQGKVFFNNEAPQAALRRRLVRTRQ